MSSQILRLVRAAVYLAACSLFIPRFSFSPLSFSPLLFFFLLCLYRNPIQPQPSRSSPANFTIPLTSTLLLHSLNAFLSSLIFCHSPSTTVPTVISEKQHSPILPSHTNILSILTHIALLSPYPRTLLSTFPRRTHTHGFN